MRSARLTIFEGPDGAGKTTLAQTYAEDTGALYLHFGSLRGIKTGAGLARHYAEALMPAVLGYQDVVMDRCWLSEEPYAEVFHNEPGRLGRAHTRMLERLALRCGAVVVLCQPPLEVVKQNFLGRLAEEMMDDEHQLVQIYDWYKRHLVTHLPCVAYDYTGASGNAQVKPFYLEEFRPPRHDTRLHTAGHLSAPVLVVGQDFAQPKDLDCYYQWPFASFGGSGCSRFVTDHLEAHGIREDELLWANGDMDLARIPTVDKKIVTLGNEAAIEVRRQLGVEPIEIVHPQFHKRIRSADPYPLGPKLLELLS